MTSANGRQAQPLLPRRLRVAVAQLNATASIEGNLEKIAQAVREARRRRAKVLLLPECATTSYVADFPRLDRVGLGEAIREVGRLAGSNRMTLLAGTPLFVGRRLFNCLVVFDDRGKPVHVYAKCQLTPSDASVFTPGNAVSLFRVDRVPATSIICHERRFPELVRLPVMHGARVLFHPNAGLDALAVSRAKRGGRDGAVARAFENAIFYVFANTVGPQGDGKWSAGDSKIVAPDATRLAWAGNREEGVVAATLDLRLATGRYALESLRHPRFMAKVWRKLLRESLAQIRRSEGELLRACLKIAWRPGA
jgi:N-carbamoylputrescine amidase